MAMAAVFARLPCKILWRLTQKEVPDQAALAQLRLGNNTKARALPSSADFSTCAAQASCHDIGGAS
jgi:hypothetical protein